MASHSHGKVTMWAAKMAPALSFPATPPSSGQCEASGPLLLILEGNLSDQLPTLAVHLVREALVMRDMCQSGGITRTCPGSALGHAHPQCP